jgi:hypothetical protein
MRAASGNRSAAALWMASSSLNLAVPRVVKGSFSNGCKHNQHIIAMIMQYVDEIKRHG